jgi:hypothetical protein
LVAPGAYWSVTGRCTTMSGHSTTASGQCAPSGSESSYNPSSSIRFSFSIRPPPAPRPFSPSSSPSSPVFVAQALHLHRCRAAPPCLPYPATLPCRAYATPALPAPSTPLCPAPPPLCRAWPRHHCHRRVSTVAPTSPLCQSSNPRLLQSSIY